ncbi:MAG: TraR/DksA family transcriptional regulator [Bacteroidetes bacterium]|nr:TraR/DksA family transcriptional regulator [Bacteroidota bacterium]MBU2584204.1 TraR/DksA family transcriptional regulator [Bacteroidota bacterium]
MAKVQKKKITPKKKTTKSSTVKKTVKKATVKKVVPKKSIAVKVQTKKRGRPKRGMKELEDAPVVVIPSKPAYSKPELYYFKGIILEKRQEILKQLEILRERMVDDNAGQYLNENSPYSLHMAEQGTDAMEKEKNYLWAQRETKFLGYLEIALKRIEDGTYGYCIDCGAIIPKGRLEAVPHSQHCISCKNKFGK